MSVINAQAQLQQLSLDSKDGNVSWKVFPQANSHFKGSDLSSGRSVEGAVNGIVPGTVFVSYVEAGKEACPEYGDNIYKVDEARYNRPFWYVTSFRLAQKPSAGQHVWLCFDNTNKFADFWFNGHKISGAADSTKDVKGHMLRSRFDITPYYKSDGDNHIAVLIYDPDEKKTRTGKDPYGVVCSPSYLAGAGWDWMPYVPGREAGITGHARVEVTGEAKFIDPWVRSYLPSRDKAEINIFSDIANYSGQAQDITVKGVIMPGNIAFTKTMKVESGDTANIGISKTDCQKLIINNPRLWWPNGYGDPNLYSCKLQTWVNGKLSDERDIRFGIKKYEYRIEKNTVGYPVLNLYINGQRIYVKGGNWGMSEYLLRCHNEEYHKWIRLHQDLNYNMIRLWTGCVTDDEFYDYCDEMGIMVWNDFWLYVAYNDVADHNAFKINARDKVRRLRNHPSIAVWCGANETHPVADLDQALRMIVMEEDGNDRLYKSCSNQDALSGSGWWRDFPPKHHFETSGSNLAFNHPAYPYGSNYGYGFRSEIGMPTFPQYESVIRFIPKDQQWPLPTDKQLKEDTSTVWNHHFFGKEASNADPISYKHAVNERYGDATSLEDFCEKAQLINLEDMRGMYEAWQDKMWNDAAGLIIWMSHPAYPSFVWQTYDYYGDPTGCYWGARKACEPLHVQWNCLNNSVKVINTTKENLNNARVTATIYDLNGNVISSQEAHVTCEASNISEAIMLKPHTKGLQFIRLTLKDNDGKQLSENFYWHNGKKYLDYQALTDLPEAKLKATLISRKDNKATLKLKNNSKTVSFANRLRLVDRKSGKRVLPVIWSDNYVTLMPGEEKEITIDMPASTNKVSLLCKQYHHKEQRVLKL
ncbi:MAG: glycosyl hydrolase 2 galactose-binding domain-containing protein [Prevotella sp.]